MDKLRWIRLLLEKLSAFIDRITTDAKHAKIVSFVLALLLVGIIGLSDGITSLFDINYRSGVVLSDLPLQTQSDETQYEVVGLPTSVDASLVGDLAELQDIVSKRSIKVGVDLTTLGEGTHVVKLIATGATENVKVNLNPSTVNVVIRKKIAKLYKFKHDIINENAGEELFYGIPNFSSDTVEVLASEFNHEKIKYITALVNVDKAVSDIDAKITYGAYDENGSKLNVTINATDQVVKVAIHKPKKEVPIKARLLGQLKDTKKAVDSISLSESTTTLYGQADVLKNLQFAEVIVPLEQVSGNDRLQLPVALINGISSSTISRVNVSITLAERKTKQHTIPIITKNLADNYVVKLVQNTMDAEVIGTQTQLSKLNNDNVKLVIDLSNVKEGEHLMPVTIEKPALIDVNLSTATVKVIITAK